MNSARKVLVVDDGHRTASDLLSTELADLGYASVTTSFEAADDVLTLIERPSAIILNMPVRETGDPLPAGELPRLAARLRRAGRASGVPVIEWRRTMEGGVSAALTRAIGSSETFSAEA